MLKLIESLSLPGDPAKQNEDAFGGSDHAVAVLDGATMLGEGLMPGPSDAAWIAQFGARRLIAHLKDEEPKKALKLAMGDAEKSFHALRRREPEAQWQVPCASLILVAETQARLPLPAKPGKGEVAVAGRALAPPPSSLRATRAGASESRRGLEFLYLGDCGALVEQGGGVKVIGETLNKRAEESARAAQIAKEKKLASASALSRPEFLSHLRGRRNQVNSGNYWLFSPDRRAAAHAGRRIVAVEKGAHLLLASDGFLALASDYGAYDAMGLLKAAKTRGLAALGRELRAIEAADPDGNTFARFKKSDDSTALLLEIV
jgi:hypothetical protein